MKQEIPTKVLAVPVANKAKSLQEATLRLMKDDRFRHPFYWAAFVLIESN